MLWYKPTTPDKIQSLPWLHADAIDALEKILQPSFEVCEFGGGGSTLWLAERVNWVSTYEPDISWLKAIDKEITNGELFLSDNPPTVERKYDLLFIDGEPVEKRRDWIKAAPQIVKPGGFMVLDNANRPEYAKERALLDAELFYTVNGNDEISKYLITEFYLMKGSDNESRKQPKQTTGRREAEPGGSRGGNALAEFDRVSLEAV